MDSVLRFCKKQSVKCDYQQALNRNGGCKKTPGWCNSGSSQSRRGKRKNKNKLRNKKESNTKKVEIIKIKSMFLVLLFSFRMVLLLVRVMRAWFVVLVLRVHARQRKGVD